jgi:hypothetical protein
MKRLNTQLASWAQLRHDNLLYVDPVYDFSCGCSYPGIKERLKREKERRENSPFCSWIRGATCEFLEISGRHVLSRCQGT